MKNQAYYDKLHFNPNAKPVGDEMEWYELVFWIAVIGMFIGWCFYQWIMGA